MTPFTSNSPLGVTLQSLWGVWTHSQGVTRRPFAIASLLQVTAYHCLPLFIQNFNSHHVFSLWPTSLQLLTKNEQTKKAYSIHSVTSRRHVALLEFYTVSDHCVDSCPCPALWTLEPLLHSPTVQTRFVHFIYLLVMAVFWFTIACAELNKIRRQLCFNVFFHLSDCCSHRRENEPIRRLLATDPLVLHS